MFSQAGAMRRILPHVTVLLEPQSLHQNLRAGNYRFRRAPSFFGSSLGCLVQFRLSVERGQCVCAAAGWGGETLMLHIHLHVSMPIAQGSSRVRSTAVRL